MLSIKAYFFEQYDGSLRKTINLFYLSCTLVCLKKYKLNLIVDVSLEVSQLNMTHASVEIKPNCKDNMNMLKAIELTYCLEGDDSSCKSISAFEGQCEKVLV